jgi:mono/diheme cytochrome c family protein
MRSGYWIAALAAACGAVAMAARSFDAVTLADYTGEELFQQFCASCHGESARGDGPVARGLVTVVPDLTSIGRRYGEFPAARIRETIDGRGVVITAHGSRVMPVWGYEFWVEEGADVVAERQARETIDKLVEYIRSIQDDADGAETRN